MRRFYFVVLEAVILLVAWLAMLIFIFCVENTNWYIKIMFGIASIFYISKFVQGVELVFDLIIGSKEKNTIFLGVYNVECLDVFHKVSYTNIYFNDDIMKKTIWYSMMFFMRIFAKVIVFWSSTLNTQEL